MRPPLKRSRQRRKIRPAQNLFDGQIALVIVTGGFLASCIVFGGGALRPSSGGIGIAVAGTAMLFTVLLYATPPRTLPRSAVIFLTALIALPAAQLVPLPPALWSALPGREVAVQVSTLVEGSTPWRPTTLSVTGTLDTLLCLSWLVALLVSVLSMTEANVRRIMLLIMALGIVDLAVGAVQFMSRGTVFNFYNNSDRHFLLGFLANKNHSGLFLASMLLVSFALAPRGKRLRREGMIWMVPAALILMVAVLATYSRAGLLLGILALVIIAAIIRGDTKRTSPALLMGLAGACLTVIALLSTALGERAVARFGLVNNDLRWLFWRGSWPLAKKYFPFGAGFGTFEHLFATDERLEWVKPTFVNNAHNDYLEAIIEAGLPAVIMIGLALYVLVRAIPPAWRGRHTLAGRWALCGAGILVLFAVHSVGDYPLRRLAPAALFFFALALVLRIFAEDDRASFRSEGRTLYAGSDRTTAIQE